MIPLIEEFMNDYKEKIIYVERINYEDRYFNTISKMFDGFCRIYIKRAIDTR